jgi:hypothetical protein
MTTAAAQSAVPDALAPPGGAVVIVGLALLARIRSRPG